MIDILTVRDLGKDGLASILALSPEVNRRLTPQRRGSYMLPRPIVRVTLQSARNDREGAPWALRW